MPTPYISSSPVIAASAVFVFLALSALLKWQYRKHFHGRIRINRGLRAYMSTQAQ